MPKISVIMSVFNGQRYLREAIDSVLTQTFSDFEFLIINDGSIDLTSSIIASYHDARIRYVENASNTGLTNSLNRGLKLAQGEYVARMDADDVSSMFRLQRQKEFLDSRHDVAVVGTSWILIGEQGEELLLRSAITDSEGLKRHLLEGNQFCHGSVMIRKKYLEKVGFYRSLFKYSQDYDLWLRLAERYSLANIQDYLYKLRIDKTTITVQYRFEQEQYAVLTRRLAAERRQLGYEIVSFYNHEEIKNILSHLLPKTSQNQKRIAADLYYRQAEIFYHAGWYRQAYDWIKMAFRNNAWNKRLFLLALKTVLGLRGGKKWISVLKNVKKIRIIRNAVQIRHSEECEYS